MVPRRMSSSRSSTATTAPATERELVVTRILDAPRDLVFRAWTRPEHVVRWWGPHGFTTHSCRQDLRPGGTFQLSMRSPEGAEHPRQGVFREIVEPERLVFTWAGQEADGRPGPETVVTVTFADHADGKTRLTLHQAVFDSVAGRESRRGGWTQILERLAACLAGS
jgi:uncharacterized protein YndB with AHSA1/START domain